MNPLPPQAYTRETLAKAYHWLQSQNESIKELATNPDILVSLYLKAKLNGDAALDRPSIQNFKNELKNLAGMIGEFEVEPIPNAAIHTYTPLPPHNFGSVGQTYSSGPQNVQGPVAAQSSSAATSSQNGSPSFLQQPTQKGPLHLEDEKLWSMIQEVKAECHLGSDQEALRLLVSIGIRKFRSFLDK